MQTTSSLPARGSNGGPAPDLAATLLRIDERLARVEKAVGAMNEAKAQAPLALATLVDTMDGVARRAQDRGIDLDERLTSGLSLLERLTDPKTQATLTRLLDLAESGPAMIGSIVDTADSLAERAHAMGIDIDDRLHVLARVLERLTAPEALAAVEALLAKVDSLKAVLASGILDPRALATVATAGDALAKAANDPATPMGLFTALRAAGDPEVKRALGFLVRFAHAFGADLHESPPKQLVEAEIR